MEKPLIIVNRVTNIIAAHTFAYIFLRCPAIVYRENDYTALKGSKYYIHQL